MARQDQGFRPRRKNAKPEPKFDLGDKVQIMDGDRVLDEGEVSFIKTYSDFLGQWKYKVKTDTGRKTWNENSLRKASAKTAKQGWDEWEQLKQAMGAQEAFEELVSKPHVDEVRESFNHIASMNDLPVNFDYDDTRGDMLEAMERHFFDAEKLADAFAQALPSRELEEGVEHAARMWGIRLSEKLDRVAAKHPELKPHVDAVLPHLETKTANRKAFKVAEQDVEQTGPGTYGWGLDEQVEQALGLESDLIKTVGASFAGDPAESGYQSNGFYVVSGTWQLQIRASDLGTTLQGSVKMDFGTESFSEDATERLLRLAPEGWEPNSDFVR